MIVKAQIGFLYFGYVGHAWWFELVNSLYILLITCMVAFFETLTVQLSVGMVIVIGKLSFFLYVLLCPSTLGL